MLRAAVASGAPARIGHRRRGSLGPDPFRLSAPGAAARRRAAGAVARGDYQGGAAADAAEDRTKGQLPMRASNAFARCGWRGAASRAAADLTAPVAARRCLAARSTAPLTIE